MKADELALDKPDLGFAALELCRYSNPPRKLSVEKLKKLVRYLATHARLVWHFKIQPACSQVVAPVGTDFAGCLETKRSTSGGLVRRGEHVETLVTDPIYSDTFFW